MSDRERDAELGEALGIEGELKLPYSFVLVGEVENITRLAIPFVVAALEKGDHWRLQDEVIKAIVDAARGLYTEIVRQAREAKP